MSEISINTLFHHSDPTVLAQAMAVVGDKDQEIAEFGYVVVERTDLEVVLLAELLGGSSVDADALLSKLRKLKPQCLGMEIYPDDGSKIKPIYYKNGRKVKKDTVVKTLREECVEFDLYYALEKGDKRTVKRILQNETVNADIAIGGIPLIFLVIESDDVESLKLLLARGGNVDAVVAADIETQNSKGEYVQLDKGTTLLMAAVHYKSPKIASWLIEHSSNINAVDRNGDSALNLMVFKECMHDLLPAAVAAGAEVNHESDRGITPLFGMLFASGRSQKYIIDHCKRLMDLDADIQHVSKNGMNARWAAHMAEYYEAQRKIVSFVESHGVTDCHAPDDFYSRNSASTYSQLSRCMNYNDAESFARIFNTAGLSPMEMRRLLEPHRFKPKEPFIHHMFMSGAPGFVLFDNDFIEELTADTELRELLKQRLNESETDKQAYVESCRGRALQLIEYLTKYTDDAAYLKGLTYKRSDWSEAEQRKYLMQYIGAAKAVQPDTLNGRLGKRMNVYFSADIADTSDKMHISIDPDTMEISGFDVRESVGWL